VFVTRPISAVFVGLCFALIAIQIYVRVRGTKIEVPEMTEGVGPSPPELAPHRTPAE